jgi:hypothetical protein
MGKSGIKFIRTSVPTKITQKEGNWKEVEYTTTQ